MLKKLLAKSIGFYLNLLSYTSPKKTGEKALELFSTPRKGKLLETGNNEFLSRFKKESLEVSGDHIQVYRRIGKGSKILLCHGWESNSSRWENLINYWDQQSFQCDIIMLDAPAHGASGSEKFNAPKYSEFINKVALTYLPEVIVGHSVGAFSVTLCLEAFGLRSIKEIILLAPLDTMKEVNGRYYRLLGLSRKAQKAYESEIHNKFPYPISYYSSADFMSKTNKSGLIIHDLKDDIHHISEAKEIDRVWRKGDLFITTGYGHSIQDEEVYAKMMDYLS